MVGRLKCDPGKTWVCSHKQTVPQFLAFNSAAADLVTLIYLVHSAVEECWYVPVRIAAGPDVKREGLKRLLKLIEEQGVYS